MSFIWLRVLLVPFSISSSGLDMLVYWDWKRLYNVKISICDRWTTRKNLNCFSLTLWLQHNHLCIKKVLKKKKWDDSNLCSSVSYLFIYFRQLFIPYGASHSQLLRLYWNFRIQILGWDSVGVFNLVDWNWLNLVNFV